VLAKAQEMAAKVTGALIPKTCCDPRQRRSFCLSLGGKNDGCALQILRNMQQLKHKNPSCRPLMLQTNAAVALTPQAVG
jgi:hypothetical protein